ncbi:PTS glucose transporter subunit IIA [Alteromonas sp. C1M14]|uniref:PTS glucose transporter subunit IIA n=1 Tax=Alteromonas sp. C1M14 TaxID=2841567 RepID=UPI001C0A3988|nr:PTS glucose transporter subunit IIA [Alteromonas sp. C1M14]MBU2978903.1 PTS glucose transporter subunit IIA [Alteromonas sp. C1M14]
MGQLPLFFTTSPPDEFKQYHGLAAPITAQPLSLEAVTSLVISQQIWGPTVPFHYSGHTLYAPAACRVETLPERGYEVRLRTVFGLKILITLSLHTHHLMGEKCERLCKPGDELAKGDAIMHIHPLWLKQQGMQTTGAIALMNGHQCQGLTLSTNKHWLAQDDDVIGVYV